MSSRRRLVVGSQLRALGAARFELGVFDPLAIRGGAMVGAMSLSERSADQVMKSVGWLAYQNALGHHIYIRPKAPHSLSLIDDLSCDGVARLWREGFAPCVTVETSPGNFQAWVDHGRVLEPRLEATEVGIPAVRHGEVVTLELGASRDVLVFDGSFDLWDRAWSWDVAATRRM